MKNIYLHVLRTLYLEFSIYEICMMQLICQEYCIAEVPYTFPSSTYKWVDVRDVANAHIQAFEISSASGRYCMVERVTYRFEAIKILHELYPAIHLPQK